MRKFIVMIAVSRAGVLLLSACHTTAGVGRDMSSAGSAITHSANEHSY